MFTRLPNRRAFMAATGCTLAAALVAPAHAADTLLTACGRIGGGVDADGCRRYTRVQFERLPQTSFTTTSPWHRDPMTYTGVSVKDFAQAIEARGNRIRLIALNDYSVTADVDQLVANGAILAHLRNGQPMPIADKGPVFVMFPFSSNAKLRADSIYVQAVWQLSRIEIV